MDEIAQRIFEAMKNKGMNQKQLASKIKAIPQTITDWKTGKTTSYTDYMASLSVVLDVSIDYLMTGRKEVPAEISVLTADQLKAIEKIKNMPPEELARKMAALEAVLDM